MSKIKISVSNGTVLEKPLVTAFKGSYGTYMVLDDERNGNMGLPVILVCKIQDNKVSSIVDQNEWTAVKESLRNLINGIQTDYVSVDAEYSADENYCSQLTLPVDYFDNLKNNYKPVDGMSLESTPLNAEAIQTPDVTPAAPVAPEAPVSEAPVMPDVPVSQPTPEPVPEAPVTPPEMPTPPVDVAPVAPEAPAAPVDAASVMPEAPTPNVTPAAEPTTPDVNPLQSVSLEQPTPPAVEPVPEAPAAPNVDFSQDKEAFLKACENMFDALVAKFTNK